MSRAGTQVTTGEIRMSYVTIDKPRAIKEGQEPKYSMSVLIPKSDKQTLLEIQEAIEEAKKIALNGRWNGKMPGSLRIPLKDGDAEKPGDEVYAGHYYIDANSRRKPLIVDKDKQEMLNVSEVYSGCYGRVVLKFYGYAAPGNMGISCELSGVQMLRDGEPLGGGRITVDAFDDFDDDSFLD